MPKLFPINIQVEEVAVGRVMRVLNSLHGVAKINFDLVDKKEVYGTNGAGEPHKSRPPRGPYKKYDETGDEALIKAMHGKPPMTVSQMADSFEAMGRARVSVHSLVHKLKSAGDLVVTQDGSYTLSKKLRDKLRHRKTAKSKKKK